jgi:transposase
VAAPVQYGPRIMGAGVHLWHGQFLSRDRACQALAELAGCAPSPGALAAAARKTAGKLAWVHSASSGKFVLVTVHAKRGKDGMAAAGVLPSFGGIAGS